MKQLAEFAMESMDFDEAERERVERDGQLGKQFRIGRTRSTGNLYLMPSGALINADDTLYNPTTIAKSLTDMLGSDWEQQNKC